MNVIFDTGSPLAWVFSEKCSVQACKGFTKFKSSKSPAFKTDEKAIQWLAYGKGAIYGHPAKDTVCFGKDENCIDNMSFLTVFNAKDCE